MSLTKPPSERDRYGQGMPWATRWLWRASPMGRLATWTAARPHQPSAEALALDGWRQALRQVMVETGITLVGAAALAAGIAWADGRWSGMLMGALTLVGAGVAALRWIDVMNAVRDGWKALRGAAWEWAHGWGTEAERKACWAALSEYQRQEAKRCFPFRLREVPKAQWATYPWGPVIAWMVQQGVDPNHCDSHDLPLLLLMGENLPACQALLAHSVHPLPASTAMDAKAPDTIPREHTLGQWLVRYWQQHAPETGSPVTPEAQQQWEQAMAHGLALWDLWAAHGWAGDQGVWATDYAGRSVWRSLLSKVQPWEDLVVALLARGVDPRVVGPDGGSFYATIQSQAQRPEPEFMGVTTSPMLASHRQAVAQAQKLLDHMDALFVDQLGLTDVQPPPAPRRVRL